MACDLSTIMAQVPEEWCEARGWFEDLRDNFAAQITSVDQIKVTRCGTAPSSALWDDCVSIPNPAIVIDFCEAPRLFWWNGAAWAGPIALGSHSNEVRAIPNGIPSSNYYTYFLNDIPESTGAIVIQEESPRRKLYSWNNTTWAEFAKPPTILQNENYPAGTLVTNANFNPWINMPITVLTGDLVTMGWHLDAVPNATPNTFTITVIAGTTAYTYTGLNGVTANGNHSEIITANGTLPYYSLFYHGGLSANFRNIYMWYSVLRVDDD